MPSQPQGERLARVETKIDGLTYDVREALKRMDGFATKEEVAEVRGSRRWALATFLPLLVSLIAVGVAVAHAS